MSDIHPIAKKNNWSIGVDYPEWANNELYLRTILGGYLQDGETPRNAYERISRRAAELFKDPSLEKDFFKIMWNGWFIPSTPVMANMGTDAALSISCFSGYVSDSLYSLARKNMEMAILSKHGGGTAYDFSGIRSTGSPIRDGRSGKSDGIIPFLKGFDSWIMASKQSKVRRGAVAAYLNVNHGDFADFLKVREPKGDINRQCLNIHQGAVIDDEFMETVINKKGEKRDLWLAIQKKRVETGEPYLFFIDNANKNLPKNWQEHNLKIRHSNLCVTGEQLVVTEGGLRLAKELYEEGNELTLFDGENAVKASEMRLIAKDADVYRIETKSGRYHTVTPDHKVLTDKGWVKCSDLKVGEKVKIQIKEGLFGTIHEPTMAHMLGIYQSMSSSFNGFNIDDMWVMEEFFERMKASKLEFKKDSVPNWILQGDKETQSHFIKGLYKRMIYDDSMELNTTNLNKTILSQVQVILSNLGIYSTFKDDSNLTIIDRDKFAEVTKIVSFKSDESDEKYQTKSNEFDTVTSITYAGKEDVFCCTVYTDEHAWVCNSFITHNCSEIMLPTDDNHTLVCCLSSLNLAKYDEWKDTNTVFLSTLFLDAVIQDFIERAKTIAGIDDAVRFAEKSRALGLGTLGWHSYLQSKMIPFASLSATFETKIIFSHIKEEADKASRYMAERYGEPEWCKNTGFRNLTKIAIAPNRTSCFLAGGLSQGIEPNQANLYVDDSAKGNFIVKNTMLVDLLEQKGMNKPYVWDMIANDRGSVGSLDFLSTDEKEVFRTFKETNQLELVRQAAVRQRYIDQGQSLNLSFLQDAPAKFVNQVHIEAWKLGIKALYYYKSESILRADSGAHRDLYNECLACHA